MYKYLLLLVLVAVILTEGCPRVTSRSSWGAASPKMVWPIRKVAKYVVMHHTATEQCQNETHCASILQTLQSEHMTGNKSRVDIGYNFLIDHSGNVYEGRGWGVSGEHIRGFNRWSVAIAIIGNYQIQQMTQQAMQAVQALIACGISNGHIKDNYEVLGHRPFDNVDCPGDNLYDAMRNWPHWLFSA